MNRSYLKDQTSPDVPIKSWLIRFNALWWVACLLACLVVVSNGRHAFAQTQDAGVPQDRQTITIQVGAHKEEKAAEKELKRLKSNGLEAFVRHEPVKGKGMWYRVYVGQFESRKAATLFATDLVDRGIINGFWVKKAKVWQDTAKAIETKQPEIEVPEIDAPKPPEAIPSEEKQITPAPGPIEPLEAAPPPEVPQAIAVPEAPPQEDLPEVMVQKEKAPPVAIGKATKDLQENRLAIGLKSSLSANPKADEFEITQASNGDVESWVFQDTKKYIGLVASIQLGDAFAIESSVERAFFTKLDLWQVGIGPKILLPQIGLLTPFVRGGLVLGDLQWDDAPGDFDTGFGWEGGLSMHLIKSRIQIGVEGSYRLMKYNYNEPSSGSVIASDDYLDLSGFTLSGTLSYLF